MIQPNTTPDLARNSEPLPNEHFSIIQPLRWSIVPEWVTLHPELTDGAMRCYAVLARFASRDDNQVWPTQATVAEKMGRGVRAVRGYFSELREAGALTELERRFDGPTLYRLEVEPPEKRRLLESLIPKNPSSEGPAKICRSVENEGGVRQKSASPSGKNLPPNDNQGTIDLEKEASCGKTQGGQVSWPSPVFTRNAVACPRCNAEASQPCREPNGSDREANHRERAELALPAYRAHLSEITRPSAGRKWADCDVCDNSRLIAVDEGMARCPVCTPAEVST